MKDDIEVYPFIIDSKRSLGSQYLNTHSKFITRTLGCNSNVQIGSPRCMFYVVHYSTKSTQKEDKGTDFERVGNQVIRRIQKETERLLAQTNESDHPNSEKDDCFREGLVRFLIGMSIHMSQDVVSSTMAHLLICQHDSRFTFSHEFHDVLVGQMLNTLEGKDPGDFVLRRRNRGPDGEVDMWPDYSVNDYIYRPDCLDNVSFYQFSECYERIALSFHRMSKVD
jgi:hypothetical protein